MDTNGGSVVAMMGKDTIVIATDRRLGMENLTAGTKASKIFKINNNLVLGMCGLFGDLATVKQKLEYNMDLFSIKNERNVSQETVFKMLARILYINRLSPFFLEALVVGKDRIGNCSITSMDCIGATSHTSSFAVIGTSSESLYGICEIIWKPEMTRKELTKAVIICFLHSIERDCLSGWGGILHLIDRNGITTKKIKTRMD